MTGAGCLWARLAISSRSTVMMAAVPSSRPDNRSIAVSDLLSRMAIVMRAIYIVDVVV